MATKTYHPVFMTLLLQPHNETYNYSESFDGMGIASHILQMVPRNWQDQYELSAMTISQSVLMLLEAFECIEKAFLTDKDCEGCTNTMKPDNPSKKKMISFNQRIRKKHFMNAKQCAVQKTWGDSQPITYNGVHQV